MPLPDNKRKSLDRSIAAQAAKSRPINVPPVRLPEIEGGTKSPTESPQFGAMFGRAGGKYPEEAPKGGDLEYFKANPHVTGMALGAGLNESPTDAPRTIAINPYSTISDNAKNAVRVNEVLRHFMDENDVSLDFEPTLEQLNEFQGTEYGKPENRKRLKETLVARILSGDESVKRISPAQEKAAKLIASQFTGE